jgi:hypothetical protein
MDKVDLDKRRDEIIEEIKRVFPVKPCPRDLINKRFCRDYEGEKISALFEGKTWFELVNHSNIVYMMSEGDYRGVLTDKSYIDYLPAFLITTLTNRSVVVLRSAFVQIKNIAARLNIDQLQTLVTYCTYQSDYERDEDLRYNFAEEYDDLMLHLLFALDEKKA